MATVRAMALRRAAAQQRLDTAAHALASRFGLDLADFSTPSSKDPEIARIVDMERTAALLEAVYAASAAEPARTKTPRRVKA